MGCRALFSLLTVIALPATLTPARALAQQNDSAYGARIAKYTTDSRFVSELVDHLPQSEAIPSPLDHFGTIIGAPDILHNTSEIYGYMRALASASARVTVRTIGKTEENRDMIEVIVADRATVSDLDRYRGYLNLLADPRRLSDTDARSAIAEAKPIYYFTGGLHSPETGPPEMLMELAYRLAVEESPFVRTIRDNVITIIVPVAEPDGRDRMVDSYNYGKAHRDVGPGLPYWGKYVAHDNNRDGYGLGLALTRNILQSYLHWKPTVMHDLHESGNFLYISTGSGPYNEHVDALAIDEWHNLAHEEVTQLTKFGMPGVWTHAFYTGWAANYLMWIANTRNSLGRFYETLGNRGADTQEREFNSRSTSREWYRPNPPLAKARWSLRNNTNYMQTGVLVGLKYVADNATDFIENFYLRGQRAVERGSSEAPYAWVIPDGQERNLAATNLVNLLLQQGIEVHVADEKIEWGDDSKESASGIVSKGSFVVRMDQPYRNLVQILLAKQNFPKDATPPYDDTGWTLPFLHNVEAVQVDDSKILSARMHQLAEPVQVAGKVEHSGRAFYLVNNTTDDNVTVFRFKLSSVEMFAAEESFKVDGHDYNAGSLVIPAAGNPDDLPQQLETAMADLGLVAQGVKQRPNVAMHELDVPRVALVHTWVSTPQSAGWWRLAFDRLEIPFAYLSEQDLAGDNLSDFDVVILPHSRSTPQQLVGGTTDAGVPIPWQQSAEYSAIGKIDQTNDVRRGMGYDGVKHLAEFVRRGGVLIAEGGSAALPIQMAITRRVSIKSTRQLLARGTVLKATVDDPASPIAYGYGAALATSFNQRPVFQVNKNVGGTTTPEWLKDDRWEKEVPRVILRFAKKDVLMSGMLQGEKDVAGTPAVVDVPVGDGHVVLFAIRPFWRQETFGSHALVFNTILNWNDLRSGWPARTEDDATTVAGGARGGN